MEVLYRSTRGNEESVSASKAILEGLASDGGLFVPQALPSFDKTLDEFAQMDYRQTAYEVMKLLLTDFTEEELRYCIDKAYDGKFDTEAIAPLAEVKNAWYLELWTFLPLIPPPVRHLNFLKSRSARSYQTCVFVTRTFGSKKNDIEYRSCLNKNTDTDLSVYCTRIFRFSQLLR